MFHSACIWGVEMYPALEQDLQIPKNSFITCSSDDTIRVWNLDRIEYDKNSIYQKNIYSNVSIKSTFLFYTIFINLFISEFLGTS